MDTDLSVQFRRRAAQNCLRATRRENVFTEPIPFTSTAGFAEDPAFSPNGNQIAYSWSPEGDANPSIYVKLIGAGTELRLTRSAGSDSMPAWSPDGRYVGFYRNLRGQSGYYPVSALGGPVRQLVHLEFANSYLGGSLGRIAWFPDGRHVALVLPAEVSESRNGEANAWSSRRIVRLDIETGEQVPLAGPSKSNISNAGLTISPNGKMLVFVHAPGVNAQEIYLLPLEGGGQPRRLTKFGAVYLGIAWSPDSKDLIFVVEQNGRRRLWRLPISGAVAYPITSSLEMISSPTVAPQGDRLAYAVYAGSTSLWEIEISGTHPPTAGLAKRFIYSSGVNVGPMYSRDGNKIVFESNRAGSKEIWCADADGNNPVQLTNSGGPDNGTPRWSRMGPQLCSIPASTEIVGFSWSR